MASSIEAHAPHRKSDGKAQASWRKSSNRVPLPRLRGHSAPKSLFRGLKAGPSDRRDLILSEKSGSGSL